MTLIVDLCGTLIMENTTRGFVRQLASRGVNRSIARLSLSRLCGLAGRITGSDVARRLQVRATRGLTKSFLYEEAMQYVTSGLATLTNSVVIEAIKEAKDQSQPVFLATASLDPIAYAVKEQLSLDGMVCSQLEYNTEGICTGRLASELLGKKWQALSSLIPVDGRDIVLYTDNPDDEDLMSRASRVHFLGDKSKLSRSISAAKLA